MKDHEFRTKAERLQLEVQPMSGVEMQKLVAELASTSPDVIAKVRAILGSSAGR